MIDIEQTYNNAITNLHDFFVKNGFSKAIVALSGGLDSAVVVALAIKALGRENVRVLLLPSKFSSDHSVSDSMEMVHLSGIKSNTLPIEPIVAQSLEVLSPIFDGTTSGLAEENLQSRIRMLLTMAVSNKTGALMLNTSNKSEIMVGYGTLYGDTCGAIGVIANLYKTDVYRLANHINKVQNKIIPQNIIDKAPSAELRENQKDSDSLPPYNILDKILLELIDNQHSAPEIVALGFKEEVVERVVKLVRGSAFKRSQLPPALKI
ncbi:MAG: NAD(+) synthase [Mucinivorans sp.]